MHSSAKMAREKARLGKFLRVFTRRTAAKCFWTGKRFIRRPHSLRVELGIAMVHQELAFCPESDRCGKSFVWGRCHRNRAGFLDRKVQCGASAPARCLLKLKQTFHWTSPSQTFRRDRSRDGANRGCNGQHACPGQVNNMDEPTSSLSVSWKSERLFELLAHLKQRGITVIYVSHRMEEIFRLCDAITVLRDGRHVVTEKIADTNRDRVIHQMVGREVVFQTPQHLGRELGEELLRVENLSSPGKFENVSFTLLRW